MLENGRKIPVLVLTLIIAIFLTAGCVQPEPTPSPSPSPSPSPETTTPPTPITKLVDLPPQQLILKTDQFPLSGYSVSADNAVGENGWGRTFGYTSESSEYWWVNPRVYVLDAPPENYPSASDVCQGWENGKISVLDAPVIGDHVIACKITFPKSNPQVTPIFSYRVYTRNVLVEMSAEIKDSNLPDGQVLDFLVALAQYQIVLIDRASPPGPAIVTAGTPKFQFSAPDELTMTAGEYFEYSFCDPEPVTPTSACGPIPITKNPTGGNPSYHFVLGPGTGFPPFGLSLSKDGVLKGKVSSTETGKTHTIEVCAIDLSADAVCRKVTISVSAPAPPPPPPCAGDAYQNTTWSGSFTSADRYTATFEFTFGQRDNTPYANLARAYPDKYGGSCDVPIVRATVNDPARKWVIFDKKAGSYSPVARLTCIENSCDDFGLFLYVPGGPGVSQLGGADFLRLEARDISATQIKGSAGAGSYDKGCCWPGDFTANRR